VAIVNNSVEYFSLLATLYTRKIGALTPRLQVMSVYSHVACARLL